MIFNNLLKKKVQKIKNLQNNNLQNSKRNKNFLKVKK